MRTPTKAILTSILSGFIACNSFAFGSAASDSANKYAMYFIGQTATSLNTIFNCTQSFYEQNNICPSNNYCALNVSSSPALVQATNFGCVATVTFATQKVSPLVQGKIVGVGPSWIPSNNAWNFDSPMISTNINDQPNALVPMKTCTPVQLFSLSSTFIGAYYSSNVVATLQDPNNSCFTTSKSGV